MQSSNPAPKPTDDQVSSILGSANTAWQGIIAAISAKYQPLDREWKTCKSAFGWVHLLRYKKRTLLYMTPEKKHIMIAMVLSQRAFQLAMESPIPEAIKTLLTEARPYAEGRGIRFPVKSKNDIQTIVKLIEIKTTF